MFKDNFFVLLVEDENGARTLLERRLGKIPNLIVVSQPNGLSAQSYLQKHVVDLIFTDIRMPLKDGLELTAYVKEFTPQCPVVIISGYDEFEYARKAIQYGVKDYLLKPIQFKQLTEATEKCCKDVVQMRKSLLNYQYHVNEELEQKINRSLKQGESTDEWSEQLQLLLKNTGTLVRIEPSEKFDKGGKELSQIYRNLIDNALPGQHVIRLAYNSEKYEYLIIPEYLENHRQLKAAPEYLERILASPVKWTEICTIETAEDLVRRIQSEQADSENAQIETAVRYMKANLGKDISRAEVAEYVYLSPSYFSHLFMRAKGMSYQEYMTELRVEKAKELLAKNMKIYEVAQAVSLHDARHFSNVFLKKTGYQPSEYRKAILNGEIPRK